LLGVDAFAGGQQVHGTNIAHVGPDRAGSGFLDPSTVIRETDGLLTDEQGVALAVLTADCVPVVLVDPGGGRLAVIHAGWRGIARGIVTEALRKYERPADLLAAIGPAIGPDHYEVGEDVAEAVSEATPSGAVTVRDEKGVRLDLPSTVAAILQGAGVRSISMTSLCTACEVDRFFSYRRDGRSGRQGVVAVRLP
jgi:YfiH family protein